jgi:uncharacterized UBP type Zn finger protein
VNGAIRVETDLKVSFEQLSIRFQDLLDEKKEELEAILKDAINNFDFKKVIQEKVSEVLTENLRTAFEGIDLSSTFKDKIWDEIEKRIK